MLHKKGKKSAHAVFTSKAPLTGNSQVNNAHPRAPAPVLHVEVLAVVQHRWSGPVDRGRVVTRPVKSRRWSNKGLQQKEGVKQNGVVNVKHHI